MGNSHLGLRVYGVGRGSQGFVRFGTSGVVLDS